MQSEKSLFPDEISQQVLSRTVSGKSQ